MFAGNIVTNLVSIIVERINPYLNYNRIGRLEEAHQSMKQSTEVSRQVNDGLIENVDKLSNMVREIVRTLHNHVRTFPEYTWLSNLLVSKIVQASNDMQHVITMAKKGRIATEAFAKLTNLHELREIDEDNTKLIAITKVNNYTINFRFRAIVEAKDIRHWDNLDETPRYMTYAGAQNLICNETSN